MSKQIEECVKLCRAGDAKAFEAIVIEYHQLVFTLAFRLLGNEEDAKDIMQDVFIKVWQNIGKYNEKYRFSTWIYRITCNVCYDKLRADSKRSYNKLEQYTLISSLATDAPLHNKELGELILKATEGLTPKQKLVFTLRELEELEISEISQITGMSSAKIRSNLYLARKHIQDKLKDYDK